MIPNAFGEKAVLKPMFAATTQAAERWRAIKITDFVRRQMAALRIELDQEYEASIGLVKQTSKEPKPTELPSTSRT